MGYEAIDAAAISFKRGMMFTGCRGSRGYQTLTGTSDSRHSAQGPIYQNEFNNPFKLPETPEIPEWVDFRGFGSGGGGPSVPRPPTYLAPLFTITVSAPHTAEVGTSMTPTVNPAWQQRDAGPVTAYRISVNDSVVWTNPSPAPRQISMTASDTVQVIRAHIDHGAGPIKNDSEGVPHPAGQIQAGTVNSANSVNIVGFRRAFWMFSNTPIDAPTTSATIRGYTNFANDIRDTRRLTLSIPAGTRTVIFAVPGNLTATTITIAGIDLPIAAAGFGQTSVPVEGAGGLLPIPYNVYHFTADTPFNQPISTWVVNFV